MKIPDLTKSKKTILKNFVYLGFMQVTNYLIPLIAIPLLVDRVGVANYGIIALAQGIMNILVTATDFGSRLTGTRAIGRTPGDIGVIKKEINGILSLRLITVLAGFPILIIMVLLVPSWQEELMVFAFSYLLVIGQALFPVWYYQGVQKMQFITLINFGSRILYISGLFLLIRQPEHYVFVNLINGVCWVFGGALGLIFVLRKHGVTRLDFQWRHTLKTMKENLPIALSTLAGTVYRNGAIVIASFFLGSSSLGVYAVLDKIILLLANTASVTSRSLLPKISELATKMNWLELRKRFIHFFQVLAIPLALLSLGLIVLGPILFPFIFRIDFVDNLTLYFVLIAAIPILVFINIPISLSIVAFDLRRPYLVFHLAALIALAVIGSFGASWLGISGILIGIIAAEITMTVVGFKILNR